MSGVECVVAAVDGTEESMRALRWGLDNVVIRPGGSFVILHVQPPPSIALAMNPASGSEVPAFIEAVEAHQKLITDAILNRALHICAHKNVNAQTHVVVGDPKKKICQVVHELRADMLLMGNRAFGPIKRWFLASVSKYCSNHASCPVLIVKADSKQPLQAYDGQ